MLRNTLQISIGASLTSPDHWLNYPDLRLIILGLIIFSLRKKITENSLQNYQNYIHAPACYFGASTPSESPFLLRRIHLHFFALRVILNLDGLVLGPRTRRDWWDDVLDGLHLVDRLATLWVWLDHGGPSYPPSWHPHRNVPLSILRNNRLLRDVHGEIFFFLLDFGRILGGYLGGYIGGCLGGVLRGPAGLGGRPVPHARHSRPLPAFLPSLRLRPPRRSRVLPPAHSRSPLAKHWGFRQSPRRFRSPPMYFLRHRSDPLRPPSPRPQNFPAFLPRGISANRRYSLAP